MEKTNIYKKLFEAKKEIGTVFKDSKNPFFKSNYLSLNGLIDAVEDVLIKNNLVLLQPIFDGKVRTEIIDIDKGDSVISEMTLPNITDPQKLGSAITYYRRYTLQSLLGLQAEDDDGNTATKEITKPRDFKKDIEKLLQAKDIESLKTIWLSLDSLAQNNKDVVNKKDEIYNILKTK